MKRFLSVDLAKCTGCRNCELACSVRHTNTFNPSRSRIHILKDETQNIIVPKVCLQCDVPLCADDCPSDALVDDAKGTLIVIEEDCTECGSCVTACVYGGIELDNVTGIAIKCDLCGSKPACIPACEYGAIRVSVDSDGSRVRLEAKIAQLSQLGLVPEEVK
jgi:carbon-monoxide dehydrogenase iron sulfur subunit